MTPTPDPTPPLLRIDDLAVSFVPRSGPAKRAVDGVSLAVHPSQTLAVVGESGSGKSVTALSVLRLLESPPARYERGRILLDVEGRAADVLKMSPRELRRIRGGVAAMIFQEPMTSLNPVYTVGDQIIEAITLHQRASGRQSRELAEEALARVGIAEPRRRLADYPHQFSGGMRQRVMIAMALACKPRLLVADEPTTALDVTVQAKVLDLLCELQSSAGLGLMLITHSLGIVAQLADVVCVMYAGRVVEYAGVLELFDRPLHPYTRGLLRCSPRLDRLERRLVTVSQVVGDPAEFDRGVGSDPRLRAWWPASSTPKDVTPGPAPENDSSLVEVEPGRWVRCWRTPASASLSSRAPDLPGRAARATLAAAGD